MSIGELNLGIPGGSASNFATTPYPSITINRWTSDGRAPSRQRLNYAALAGRSIAGTSQIVGPIHLTRFQWSVFTVLTLAEMRLLVNLADWQDDQYKDQNDGKLRLIDEIQYLSNIERSQNGRTLLAELDETYDSSVKYGFGVFNVKLQLSEDFNAELGLLGDDVAHVCTFQIIEV